MHIYMYVCTHTSSLIIHLDCDAIILVPNSHIVNPNVPTLNNIFAPYCNPDEFFGEIKLIAA